MTRLDRLYDSLVTSAAGAGNATPGRLAARAGDLRRPVTPVEAATTNDVVFARFSGEATLDAVAVVQGGTPIGLIDRHRFMEGYARPFARDLHGRRACATWMDGAPLVVDGATPIEELVRLAVAAGPATLKVGFVVLEEGRYAGLGTGHALLEAISGVEAEKTRQLLESIRYASRIQRAYLRASDEELVAAVPDHALVWEPRDLVGGDCYFARRVPGGTFGALIDCTGHGVPGAFMTLIVLSWLELAFDAPGAPQDPGAVLSGLNRHVKRVLGQGAADDDGALRADDGLDGACLFLPDGGGEIAFASARIPLVVVRPGAGAPEVLEGERTSVGYQGTPADQRWPVHRVDLPPGALLALSTDGLIDQVGGPRRIAHGRRRLVELLGEHRGLEAPALAGLALEALGAWQGAELRRDDVALLLLRPGRRR